MFFLILYIILDLGIDVYSIENINKEKHKPLIIFLNIKWLIFVLFNLKKNINKNNNIKRNNYIKV